MEKTTDKTDALALNQQSCEITSDDALSYVRQILLEESIDENINAYTEEAALRVVEKPFYDILEQEYPSSSNNLSMSNFSDSSSHMNNEILVPILQFQRGMEEGLKFLPSIGSNNYWFRLESEKDGNKDKKRANTVELLNLQGPKYKISTLYFNDPAMDDMYEKVLLLHGYTKSVTRLSKIMKNAIKQSKLKETQIDSVDLRTLLIHCSQSIARNDFLNAKELIKQIRKHSSPLGDGVQRMAHIFANGLEARLAGTANELIYRQPISTRANVIDVLKAYWLFEMSSPFARAAYFFANHIILDAITTNNRIFNYGRIVSLKAKETITEGFSGSMPSPKPRQLNRKALKLHIIHFGIDFGFQWPHLMLALSERVAEAPKLRITGIDNPQPGFRPNERVEEVGRRLQEYATNFSIPFEYKGIAAKWDEICIEDLNIEKDELVIVNCLHGFENIPNETDVMYSPRDGILDIIRRIKPHIFIEGIINGSFSGDMFAPRFRQVLLHYSAMFDLLDSTVPSDCRIRHFIENKIWAYDVINLIACEGSKMVERTETYRQREVRNIRAGFEQLPIDSMVVKKMKKKDEVYNKNFFIEDDKKWLLVGWRGRTMYAVSTWRVRDIN